MNFKKIIFTSLLALSLGQNAFADSNATKNFNQANKGLEITSPISCEKQASKPEMTGYDALFCTEENSNGKAFIQNVKDFKLNLKIGKEYKTKFGWAILVKLNNNYVQLGDK